jgi:hypothetical protein
MGPYFFPFIECPSPSFTDANDHQKPGPAGLVNYRRLKRSRRRHASVLHYMLGVGSGAGQPPPVHRPHQMRPHKPRVFKAREFLRGLAVSNDETRGIPSPPTRVSLADPVAPHGGAGL